MSASTYLLLASLCGSALMAQNPTDLNIPFSDAEIRSAFRVSMPRADADDAVREFRSMRTIAQQQLEDYRRDPVTYVREGGFVAGESPAFGIGLSDDTLIILSLLSDDLKKRVRVFRGLKEGQQEDPSWQRRVRELEPLVTRYLQSANP